MVQPAPQQGSPTARSSADHRRPGPLGSTPRGPAATRAGLGVTTGTTDGYSTRVIVNTLPMPIGPVRG